MSGVSTTVRIREATAADVAALVALNREVQALHARLAPEVFKVDTTDSDIAALFAERIVAVRGRGTGRMGASGFAFQLSFWQEAPFCPESVVLGSTAASGDPQ